VNDTEYNAATPDTSYIAVSGGTFIIDNSTFPSISGNGRPLVGISTPPSLNFVDVLPRGHYKLSKEKATGILRVPL
jgi:hypothetical protein